MKISYILLVHRNPTQVARLVSRLHAWSPIFIHVDRRVPISPFQRALESSNPGGSLRFVKRHRCRWGQFGIVQATLEGINALIASGCDFDYAMLLCGQDYPIRSMNLIAEFLEQNLKRLVFVDETGINTAMTPTHAWARRGQRAIGSVPTSWGSTTVIAALSLDGVRAPLVFPGATDTQAFQTYVDEVLAPELHPGDVVIFDNLKPHLAPHVAESIKRAGASVLPLPPYSSDYDPIEELWSKFKGELRRVAARVRNDLYNAVGETLDHVTLQDIVGWFNHSGLYATHA